VTLNAFLTKNALVAAKIEQAELDAKQVEAMKGQAGRLKTLVPENQRDVVDELNEELHEGAERVHEVTDALRGGAIKSAADAEQEDEIDREIAAAAAKQGVAAPGAAAAGAAFAFPQQQAAAVNPAAVQQASRFLPCVPPPFLASHHLPAQRRPTRHAPHPSPTPTPPTHTLLPRPCSMLQQKVEALEAAAFELSMEAPQAQAQKLQGLQQQCSGIAQGVSTQANLFISAGMLPQLQEIQMRNMGVKTTLDGIAQGVGQAAGAAVAAGGGGFGAAVPAGAGMGANFGALPQPAFIPAVAPQPQPQQQQQQPVAVQVPGPKLSNVNM
jgi:hypothetical protein